MASTFEIKTEQTPSVETQKGYLIGQAAVRTIGIATTLIAIVTTSTAKQTITLFGMPLDAKYSYSPAFRFFVGVNVVACALSLVSLSLLLFCVRLANPGKVKYYTIFLIDLMVMVMALIGTAAAFSIAYLGKYGNDHTGWMPICDHFGKFCHKIIIALVSSSIASLLFTILTAWSAWKSTKVGSAFPIKM